MVRESVRGRTANPTLVEDVFVLQVLVQYRLVDQRTIAHIREDFRRLEQFGLKRVVNEGKIELCTLFEHLTGSGHVLDSNRVAPDSTYEERREARLRTRWRQAREAGGLPQSVVDMATPDMGFGEWVAEVWTPYLEAQPEYANAVASHRARRTGSQASSASAHGSLRRQGTEDLSERSTVYGDESLYETSSLGQADSRTRPFSRACSSLRIRGDACVSFHVDRHEHPLSPLEA